jgi:hypothetical protein
MMSEMAMLRQSLPDGGGQASAQPLGSLGYSRFALSHEFPPHHAAQYTGKNANES